MPDLPNPTTDLDRVAADLAEHGYGLVAEGLEPAAVHALREQVATAAQDDRDRAVAFHDGGGANQRVWQLLNRGPDFGALAVHPVALEMMGRVLVGRSGSASRRLLQFLLSSITANITGPGGQAMVVHADQGWAPPPWPARPLVANVAWMLDDFTAANGATVLVPGSHHHDGRPGPGATMSAVPVEAPAGTALLLDGRTWHGTGANTTPDQHRHAVLAYYCQPWIRQQENSTVSVRPEVVAEAPPALRRLMGFDRYQGLGMINGLPPLPAG